jgi:hypothetical protein
MTYDNNTFVPPVGTRVPIGTHQVKVKKNGYYDWIDDEIRIKKSYPYAYIHAFLRPVVGKVNVSSSPGGAGIFIDKGYAGVTPQEGSFEIENVSFGYHIVKLVKSGYDETNTSVIVDDKDVNEVFISLSKSNASSQSSNGPSFTALFSIFIIAFGCYTIRRT